MSNECPAETPFHDQDGAKSEMDSILASMGATEKCSQMAREQFELDVGMVNNRGSAGAAAGGGCLLPFIGCFGGGGGASDFGSLTTTTSTGTDSMTRNEGCGTLLLDMQEIALARRNMTCILSSTENSSVVTIKQDAVVQIMILPHSDTFINNVTDTMQQQSQTKNDGDLAFYKLLMDSDKELDPKRLELVTKLKETATKRRHKESLKLIDTLQNELNVDKSTITASSNVNVIQVNELVLNSDMKFTDNLKSMTNSMAEHSVSNELTGAAALTPNTKMAIKRRVNDKVENSLSQISNVINSNRMDVNATTGIKLIISGGRINISGTELNANMVVNLKLESITQKAQALASDVVADIIDEIATTLSSTHKHDSGLNDLVDTVAKMNVSITENVDTDSGATGLFKSMQPFLIVVAVAMCVAGLYRIFTASRKGDSATTAHAQLRVSSPPLVSTSTRIAPPAMLRAQAPASFIKNVSGASMSSPPLVSVLPPGVAPPAMIRAQASAPSIKPVSDAIMPSPTLVSVLPPGVAPPAMLRAQASATSIKNVSGAIKHASNAVRLLKKK